jgi:hypothetical protein
MFSPDLNVSESVGVGFMSIRRNLFDIGLLNVARARRIYAVHDPSQTRIDINEVHLSHLNVSLHLSRYGY